LAKVILFCRYDYGVNRSKFLNAEELAELEKKGIIFQVILFVFEGVSFSGKLHMPMVSVLHVVVLL
jgi:hypothetical protein